MNTVHPQVKVYADRQVMGEAAAKDIARELRHLQTLQDEVQMIFAAAPSQNEFLDNLIGMAGIEWERVTAFHMDEYIGLPPEAAQRFGNFLRTRLFDRLPFKSVEYINTASPPAEECRRYSKLLRKKPIDIVCLGIGENGHIAFNDPPAANFQDTEFVKVVTLDDRCRLQQVHDGSFASVHDVPRQALTLTIPALLSGEILSIVVPGSQKANAVRNALEGPISTTCPASILRTHKRATLYLDRNSSSLLSWSHQRCAFL